VEDDAMKISEFKFEIAPRNAEQDDYDVLIQDDNSNYFEVAQVRWDHNEKRVVIEAGDINLEANDA
jgi:hypothetical protein